MHIFQLELQMHDASCAPPPKKIKKYTSVSFHIKLQCWMKLERLSAVRPAEVNSSIPVDFLMSSFSETAGLLCVTGYFQ